MTDLTDEEKSVQDMYGCEENPLFYKIRPKCTIEFTNSSEITKEDFMN